MKGLELRNQNCSISIFPHEETETVDGKSIKRTLVCLQVTKKKTRDVFYLERKEWLALSAKVLEICFSDTYNEVNEAIEKSFEQRIIKPDEVEEPVKLLNLDGSKII
jgi:hypothetical protein